MPCFESTAQTPFLKSLSTLFPYVLGAVRWEVEERVKRSLANVAVPPGCPPKRLFVEPSLRATVIHWAHTSLFACHPGIR